MVKAHFICIISLGPIVIAYVIDKTESHCYLEGCKTFCIPGGLDGKASAYSAGDLGLIPRPGRSSGEGNDNPLQYSCLDNPMDGGT